MKGRKLSLLPQMINPEHDYFLYSFEEFSSRYFITQKKKKVRSFISCFLCGLWTSKLNFLQAPSWEILVFILSINFQCHQRELKGRVLHKDKDETFWTLQLYAYPFLSLSYQTRNLISNGEVVSLKILTFSFPGNSSVVLRE